ncbi:MAG TPA: EpsG family protein, partial [Flavobacterium sp.]|nr:EpsG family protein [Flavobacterium sp.]
KLWKFLLCFAIAFMFHKAVVAFILAYWVVKIRFNNAMIISIVVGAVIANIIGLSTAIDGIMQFMPFGVAETYNDYANEFSESGLLGDIVKVLTVAVIIVFNTTAEENDEYYAYFRNIYLLGVILYFFFGGGIFAARLPVFFTVYLIFLVPRMIKALKENEVFKNVVYIAFITYTLLLYVNFYQNWGDKSGFGNYTTVFNKWVPYSFFQREF